MLIAMAFIVCFMAIGVGVAALVSAARSRRIVEKHTRDTEPSPIASAARGELIDFEGVVDSEDDVPCPSGAAPAALVIARLDRALDNVGARYDLLRQDVLGREIRITDATGTAIVETKRVTLVAPVTKLTLTERIPEPYRQLAAADRGPDGGGVLYQELTVRRGDRARVTGLVLAAADEVARTAAGAYRDAQRPAVRVGGPVSIVAYDLLLMKEGASRSQAIGAGLIAFGLLVLWLGVSAGR